MKKRPWKYSKGVKITRYHLDSQNTLPQNAITGAPGNAYLSTFQLQDHVHQILPYPLRTNRGSLNGCVWLLFFSQLLKIYLNIIPTMGEFVN